MGLRIDARPARTNTHTHLTYSRYRQAPVPAVGRYSTYGSSEKEERERTSPPPFLPGRWEQPGTKERRKTKNKNKKKKKKNHLRFRQSLLPPFSDIPVSGAHCSTATER